MSEYKIVKEIYPESKWCQATASIELDIDVAKQAIRILRQADPTLLVMSQDVAFSMIRWMKVCNYSIDKDIAFYLLRHQLPPRFMDMKVLVIPVEFSFMFPELDNDVWVVYEKDVVVLKGVIE